VTYEWKIPSLYPVDAQTAGEELERICEKYGVLQTDDIVNESRAETARLHACFEWDDLVAAEKYRKTQAGDIVRAIVIKAETKPGKVIETRAFVHAENAYHPLHIALNSESMTNELYQSALRDLAAIRGKYASLAELHPVFSEIDKLTA